MQSSHPDIPQEELARTDYVSPQGWERYTGEDHAIWRALFERQSRLLPGRACRPYLDGLARLAIAADGIPDFRRLSDALGRATGWQVVAVPGLVPDDVFFRHLAARRFPATTWIRRPDQMDYLQEPDVFHDVLGHVPILMDPVFADYLQAYGRGGRKAQRLGALHNIARLYRYTVEFGLILTAEGLRIYGSGIVSSRTETLYCLESAAPRRIAFDLMRIMRTAYRIDDLQLTYFVIDGFERLFTATRPDFTPYYRDLRGKPDIPPGAALPTDRLVEVAATRAA
ncbi:MAG: phenylalanine 4-monooxygenase [Rhodospirillaceae bacterium]|nr:phenylalanine 4-monooxygenase [Rhodospirillaceae bacterium]